MHSTLLTLQFYQPHRHQPETRNSNLQLILTMTSTNSTPAPDLPSDNPNLIRTVGSTNPPDYDTPWENIYLGALAQSLETADAARKAHIPLHYVVERRETDPEFAREEAFILRTLVDRLRSEAIRRCLRGLTADRSPEFVEGKGRPRRFGSDSLLLALLRAFDPAFARKGSPKRQRDPIDPTTFVFSSPSDEPSENLGTHPPETPTDSTGDSSSAGETFLSDNPRTAEESFAPPIASSDARPALDSSSVTDHSPDPTASSPNAPHLQAEAPEAPASSPTANAPAAEETLEQRIQILRDMRARRLAAENRSP
jgi:hypothetical protein